MRRCWPPGQSIPPYAMRLARGGLAVPAGAVTDVTSLTAASSSSRRLMRLGCRLAVSARCTRAAALFRRRWHVASVVQNEFASAIERPVYVSRPIPLRCMSGLTRGRHLPGVRRQRRHHAFISYLCQHARGGACYANSTRRRSIKHHGQTLTVPCLRCYHGHRGRGSRRNEGALSWDGDGVLLAGLDNTISCARGLCSPPTATYHPRRATLGAILCLRAFVSATTACPC